MFNIDSNWTLFLDRDGVINRRLPGAYVRSREEFVFETKVLAAMKLLATLFFRIVVVTNQQGIGKGLMTERDLELVHQYLLESVEQAGGRIDGIYFCPALANANAFCRKPEPGMALAAQKDFPEIDFQQSIMVGDSLSDMAFGERLGMKTVFIESKAEDVLLANERVFDARFSHLWTFAQWLNQK